MQIYDKRLDEIKPYENNPRHNDNAVDAVSNSIREFGFKVPIVVDSDGVIVAGHTRYKAAQKLGLEKVPCIVANDLTEQQVKAFRLADNKVGELATWDLDTLKFELDNIGEIDMSEFGFNLDGIGEEPQEVHEDDFDEEPPEEPTSKLGDIYKLGEHRLMCGDSTNPEHVAKLMDGAKAELLLTDPPYGVKRDKGFGGFCGFGGLGKPIKRREYSDEWDDKPIDKSALDNGIQVAEKSIIFGGNFFTDKLPVGNFWIVWDKQNTMPTFGDCELAWTNIKRNSVKKYEVQWNGLIGKEKERFHPTQKPIELMGMLVRDFSQDNGIVLDLFGGSGSTLIACEQLNRKCYMMEMSPKYVDVIIRRWEEYTGKKAVKIA